MLINISILPIHEGAYQIRIGKKNVSVMFSLYNFIEKNKISLVRDYKGDGFRGAKLIRKSIFCSYVHGRDEIDICPRGLNKIFGYIPKSLYFK